MDYRSIPDSEDKLLSFDRMFSKSEPRSTRWLYSFYAIWGKEEIHW